MASGRKSKFCRYPELKKRLDICGIRIREAAEICGCSETAFSMHLNGHSDFKVSEAKKIAKVIGMPIEALFKEETI